MLTTPGLPVDFSFSWRPSSADAYQPDGGFVLVECRHGKYAHFPKGIGLARELAKFVDPSPILAAAEKLRNERRRLAEDGSEWRCVVGPGTRVRIATFSAPTLTGLTIGWDDLPDGATFVTLDESDGWPWDHDLRAAVLIWHRAAYVLQPDECYPPGELPRKMAEDEVRGKDGSVWALTIGFSPTMNGPSVRIGESYWWHPGMPALWHDHPAHDASQLSRLQAFWERSQPKEDGPPEELAKHPLDSMARTFTDEPDALLIAPEPARVTDVRFNESLRLASFRFEGQTWFFNGDWSDHSLKDALHPLDIALIERCWAEGRKDTFQGTHVGWSQADEAAFRKAWEDERNKQNSGPEVAASALAAKPVLNADSQREAESAVVTEAHSVTPSGEVKAPEEADPLAPAPVFGRAFSAEDKATLRETDPLHCATELEVAAILLKHIDPSRLVAALDGETRNGIVCELARSAFPGWDQGDGVTVEMGLDLIEQRDAALRRAATTQDLARQSDANWSRVAEGLIRERDAALSDHIRRVDGTETDDRASMWETTAMCEGARREQAERERDEAKANYRQACIDGNNNAKIARDAIERAQISEQSEHLAAKQRDETQARNGQLQARLHKIADIANGTIKPEPAPDLTELREALKKWNDEGPWTASEQLAAAVERLVGK
jgi:hypothetical protein